MTHPTLIVFDELDRDGRHVSIDDDHATVLAGTRLVEARADRNGWRLVPTGRVGSVRIGGLQVEVRPKDKVGLTRLLFLLGYARDPGWRPETVAGRTATTTCGRPWPSRWCGWRGLHSARGCCRATGPSTSRCAPCAGGSGSATRSPVDPG